jgi:putative transposase
LIDYESLMDLPKFKSMDELEDTCKGWVEESLERQDCERQPRWTESIAVGMEVFVENTKEKLGIKAVGRKVIGSDGTCELREPEASYDPLFALENSNLSSQSTYYWEVFILISIT